MNDEYQEVVRESEREEFSRDNNRDNDESHDCKLEDKGFCECRPTHSNKNKMKLYITLEEGPHKVERVILLANESIINNTQEVVDDMIDTLSTVIEAKRLTQETD